MLRSPSLPYVVPFVVFLAFLALHSLLHIGETIMGHHHDVLLNEILAVHVPSWLAVVIAYLQSRKTA